MKLILITLLGFSVLPFSSALAIEFKEVVLKNSVGSTEWELDQPQSPRPPVISMTEEVQDVLQSFARPASDAPNCMGSPCYVANDIRCEAKLGFSGTIRGVIGNVRMAQIYGLRNCRRP